VEQSPLKTTLAGLHVSEWGAELMGTAILMIGGLSAVALDFGRVPSGAADGYGPGMRPCLAMP
jgi:hypothetical protein